MHSALKPEYGGSFSNHSSFLRAPSAPLWDEGLDKNTRKVYGFAGSLQHKDYIGSDHKLRLLSKAP
jgi:hypothetical protein